MLSSYVGPFQDEVTEVTDFLVMIIFRNLFLVPIMLVMLPPLRIGLAFTLKVLLPNWIML